MAKKDYLLEDWLVAQIAGALCDCKQIVEEPSEEDVVVHDDKIPSAFVVAARKEAFGQLSTEAKDLAELLFEAPAELLDLISFRGNPSQRRLWSYLRSLGWQCKLIKGVFEELKVFVKENL